MASKIARREFLIRATGALAIGGVGPNILPAIAGENDNDAANAPSSLRILIIGGTGFVGSHQVHRAVARGHKVTVFSRGDRKMDLPENVEVLKGDRYKNLAWTANRDWDAVIDCAAFAPLGVRTLGQALKGQTGQYMLISSVAVYERPSVDGQLGETSPLVGYGGSEDPYSLTGPRTLPEYGALKVLCEAEAEKQFPGRALTLRLGYPTGPAEAATGDEGQIIFWTLRMEKGGEVMVAGEPATPVQFIDVRDLADWCIRLVEKRATGIFNVTGPATPLNLRKFIEAANSTRNSPTLTWVPASWLATQPDKNLWGKLLLWSWEGESWGWAMRMTIDKALAAGLTFRPMTATRRDTVDWYRHLSLEQQAKLLPVSWPEYLQREKELLVAWHARTGKSKGEPL